MPTNKPRVWVTLEPAAYQVLLDMAALGKTSPGRVLSDIAAPVLPALAQLVDASKRFQQWEKSFKGQLSGVHKDIAEGIGAAVAALEARMVPSGGVGGVVVPELLGEAPEPSLDPAGGTGRARMPRSGRPVPEALSTVPNTPPSNTGVRQNPHKQNQGVSKGGRRG